MTIKSLTDERNKIRKQKNFSVCVSLLDKLFHIKLEFCVEVFGCIWIMATCIFVIEMLRVVLILTIAYCYTASKTNYHNLNSRHLQSLHYSDHSLIQISYYLPVCYLLRIQQYPVNTTYNSLV